MTSVSQLCWTGVGVVKQVDERFVVVLTAPLGWFSTAPSLAVSLQSVV